MIKLKKRYLLIIAIVLGSAFTYSDNLFEISKNLEIFADVYKTTNQLYVDEPKSGELMKTGIRSMLKTLDPYTYFFSESEAEDAMVAISGEYGGLGFSLEEKGDYLTVIGVFDNSPAQKSDIRIGDQISEVNGRAYKGVPLKDVGNAFKGPAKTEVSLKLIRPGIGNIEKSLRSAEIRRKNVPYYGKVDDKTGYIILTSFKQNCANEIKDAFIKLKKQGVYRIVLDLRDNPGGLVNEAVHIVNIFTPKNTIAVETKGRHSSSNFTYKTAYKPIDKDIPIVVLVNGKSASASEIVSGCLQDLDRGVVLGETTYGKGLVQTIKNLKYRTQMRVTTAKYYTPSGRCIQRIDYSKKDKNGKAMEFSDENRKVFYTTNKRKVLDGKGIEPDVVMEKEKFNKFVSTLEKSNAIFDFAVVFSNQNRKNIKNFTDVKPEVYNLFVKYCLGKNKDFKTAAEVLVDSMKAYAKNSQEISAESLLNLQDKVTKDKANLFKVNAKIISLMLSKQILKNSLSESEYKKELLTKDAYLRNSLEILDNPNRYRNILNPN